MARACELWSPHLRCLSVLTMRVPETPSLPTRSGGVLVLAKRQTQDTHMRSRPPYTVVRQAFRDAGFLIIRRMIVTFTQLVLS